MFPNQVNYDSMLLYAVLLFVALFFVIFACILLANMCGEVADVEEDQDYDFGFTPSLKKRNTISTMIGKFYGP